ncbi:MAG: DUF3047 domain-containing protein [Oleiphilus sp.]
MFNINLKKRCSFTIVLCLYLSALSLRAETEVVEATTLSLPFDDLDAWEEIRFNSRTHYQKMEEQEQVVLKAESRNSASGLLLEQDINLQKTPYLNWRWKLEKALPTQPEKQKSGDDYAARVYLIHSGGWLFWQTHALNYVWSSRSVKGQAWPNAYAPDNAQMMAIRDAQDKTGVWFQEKRHVGNDFSSWLSRDIQQIDGVAIMTDTDDSQGHAIVYYADIFFSAE